MTPDNFPDGSGYANLVARQEIHDALLRYCWGIDRGDLELVLSAFHEDALDNHGGYEERAVDRFRRTVVEGSPMRTSHHLGNVLIQVDGLRAAAQSYLTAWHQFSFEGRSHDWVIAGRYLDQFECRKGQWRISHRTVVYDIERFTDPGTRPDGHPAAAFFEHVIRGERSRNDYSYRLMRV